MSQITLDGLKEGSSNLVHFLMRPEDFDFLPDETKKLLQDIIDEQEIELIPHTFVLSEQQNEQITCKIPNLCKDVFDWFSRYSYENKRLIVSRPYSEVILSLYRLYRDYSKNPEGWIVPYDASDELTRFNIKSFIQYVELSDSLDRVGGYHINDYILFQSLLISEIVAERSYIMTRSKGSIGFSYLMPRTRPKKYIPCTCMECGLMFLNQSHPKKLCKRCENEKEKVVKNRVCACGCGKYLPERFTNKKYFNKACITRARREREKENKK